MKKKIIPRRDHEVYFIPLPQGIKTKQIKDFTLEQLDRLHPGFSMAPAFDLQHFVFNKKRWIMATVMEAETLVEYRLLNKGAVFYTNTSIAAHGRNFTDGGINEINGERIGFDAEKNLPVSEPLETEEKKGMPETAARLGSVPPWHGVFRKKTPGWIIASIAAAAILLFLILFISNITPTAKTEPVGRQTEQQAEAEAEIKYLPGAIEILTRISSDIVEAGGKMPVWQYNENNDPLIVMQLRGIEVLEAQRIYSRYEYAYLQDIKNVNYIDGMPHITVSVNTAKTGHAVLEPLEFPDQSSILPLLMEIKNNLKRNGISIVSELLPVSGDSKIPYTITYTAKDKNLIRSLEIINDACDNYSLRVKTMDISISGDMHGFTVICALAYCNPVNNAENGLGNEKNMIPLAFGYREPPLLQATPVASKPEKKPEPPAIGTIKSGDDRVIFYRDTTDGKIKTR
jgi:hypothetical protein